MRTLNRHRLWQAVVDSGLVALAWMLAFNIRFDYGVPPRYQPFLDFDVILVVVGVKILTFIVFGLYDHWWRYVSIRDIWRSLLAVTVASVIAVTALYFWNPVPGFRLPRGIIVIDWLILLGLVAGTRLAARTIFERPGRRRLVSRGRDVLVVGAGDAGQLILREMLKNPNLGYSPTGLVDDDPRKKNLRLHGVRVLGTTDDLAHLLRDNRPDEVIIAIPSAAGETRQRIVNECRDVGVPVKTLPAVHELISGDLNLARQLREVQVEDVLGREAVELDLASIASYVTGETVLVTGAGGSIGSELCRQIAALGADRIILVDHTENALVDIERELAYERRFNSTVPVLADVKNRAKMRRTFDRFRPGVVFHAAAYKHVPLMEANPVESVRNNVFGTGVGRRRRLRVRLQALRPRLDGQGREPEERPRADEGRLRVDRRGGCRARAQRHAVHLGPLRQRARLVGKRDPALPPPDRARRPGDRDASRDDALLHDDPGSRPAHHPGRRDRGERRDLRARHGPAREDHRSRAQHDPPLRQGARRGRRGGLHRRAPGREAARGAMGEGRGTPSPPRTRRSCAATACPWIRPGSRTSSPSSSASSKRARHSTSSTASG